LAERLSTSVNKPLGIANFSIRCIKLFSALAEHVQGLFELGQGGFAGLVSWFHDGFYAEPAAADGKKWKDWASALAQVESTTRELGPEVLQFQDNVLRNLGYLPSGGKGS